jgi:hypothetical protein
VVSRRTLLLPARRRGERDRLERTAQIESRGEGAAAAKRRELARDQVDEPDDGRGARAHLSLPEPHPAPDDPRVAGGASRTVDLCGVCGGELAAPAAIEESAKLGRTSEARRAEQALPPFTPERWTWSHRAAIK